MAKTIRTCDGDVLDTICYAYYGHLQGAVEAVLEVNPGLAAARQPFAAGLIITLPDLPAPKSETIQLWS